MRQNLEKKKKSGKMMHRLLHLFFGDIGSGLKGDVVLLDKS
jgi:hypothetical protein